jgi:hypothetical protein
MRCQILIISFIIFLTLSDICYSQTITVDSLSKTDVCVGDKFTVYFTASGQFSNNNIFYVQISNPNGDFTKFNNIGSIISDVSGSIECTIPEKFTSNIKYKIRITSNDPYIMSNEFTKFLSVYKYPIPKVSIRPYTVFVNEPITIYNNSIDGYTGYWEFGEGSSLDKYWGKNPPEISYSTDGIKQIDFWITNKAGCSTKSRKIVPVFNCNPKIDSNAVVIDTNSIAPPYFDSYWICSQGIYQSDCYYSGKIFMETRAAVYFNYVEGYPIIFMKSGASLNINHYMMSNYPEASIIIIYEEGASININHIEGRGDSVHLLQCYDLQFDYSDAPEKGLIAQHLAVDDNFTSNSIKIYPNPGDGVFNISLNFNKSITTISVINVLGNEVYNRQIKNIEESWQGKIDLSRNPAGLYFLKLSDGVQNSIEKIILE